MSHPSGSGSLDSQNLYRGDSLCFLIFRNRAKNFLKSYVSISRLRVQGKSPWAALGREFTQHEGRAFSYEQIIDESKRIVETGFEEMVVPIRVEFKDIPDLVGEALLRKLDELADNIAEQTSRLGQRRLTEATRLAGTAIDAGGQPFTQELFLQSESARDWEFDHLTGQQEGVYIAHPQTAERMHNIWQEWEQDSNVHEMVANQS